MSEDQIKDDFVPCFLLHIDLEGNNDIQIELTERIASIFGLVLFKLKKYDIHIKYKDQIIEYYKALINHKEITIVQKAVYNLPCMHILYKSIEKQISISFGELYLKFS